MCKGENKTPTPPAHKTDASHLPSWSGGVITPWSLPRKPFLLPRRVATRKSKKIALSGRRLNKRNWVGPQESHEVGASTNRGSPDRARGGHSHEQRRKKRQWAKRKSGTLNGNKQKTGVGSLLVRRQGVTRKRTLE